MNDPARAPLDLSSLEASALELLADISATLARCDDLDEGLDSALRATVKSLGFASGALFLKESESGDLRLSRHVVGLAEDYAAAVSRFRSGEALLGRVLDSEQPLLVPDLSNAPEARAATRTSGLRTCVFAPLFARGAGVGVLAVGGREKREIPPQLLQVLSAIGAMLGAAVDRSSLLDRTRRHLAQVQALWEIDRAIVEDRELADVLDTIAREAAELGGGDSVIALFEPSGELRAAGSHGLMALRVLDAWPASAGTPLAERLLEPSPASVALVDLPDRPRALLLPLKAGRRALGGLLVVKPEADLREDDLTLLATFAHQAAVALAKARIRDSEDRRAAQLALVSGASEIAGSTLVLDELLGALARYVQRTFGYYAVSVYLCEAEPRECVLAGAAGAASLMPRNHRLRFGEGIIGWVAEAGECVMANDVSAEPRFVPGRMEATRAELAVPVQLGLEVVAVINVESDRPGAFDEGDLVALDAIASQVAAAVRNARLFEEKLRALRHLEVVQEITNVLNSDLDLDALLDRIARRSVEAVRPAQMGAVLLFDEQLRVRSSFGYPNPEALASIRLEFHEGLPGGVFVSGHGRVESSRAGDYGRESEAFRKAAGGARFRSAVCVPIALPQEKLGVLLLQTTTAPEPFDADASRLATTLAHQAAIAIGNALQLRKILELDRHRQSYLSNVSHELRTPLTVIHGYLEAVIEGTAGDKRGEFLEVAFEQCVRLEQQIDEMLEVSRLERGALKRHVEFAPVDLRTVVAHAVAATVAEARVRKVTVASNCSQVPDLVGDERLLKLMAQHLVQNAVKFVELGGRVEVRLEKDGTDLVLQVEDDGPGVAAEHQEKIFEKFFAVDSGLSRKQGGTGIGLYLARGIAAIHAGSLQLESPCRGQRGSRFEARLPVEPRN